MALFRRTKPEPAPQPAPEVVSVNSQKKGRPTPSRREAEAANKARAKVPRTRKEQAAARRSARNDSMDKTREAMRTGDDRYLPARDRGPVRRFVRDFVDSQFSILEVMMPLMLAILILGWVGAGMGSLGIARITNAALPALILLVAVEGIRLWVRLRKELARRFPDQSHRGATSYAIMRALQVRPWRKPDRQVSIGQQLPEHYR